MTWNLSHCLLCSFRLFLFIAILSLINSCSQSEDSTEPSASPGITHDLWIIDTATDRISRLNLSDEALQFQFFAPAGITYSEASQGLAWDGEFIWTFHLNSSTLYKVDIDGEIKDSTIFPEYFSAFTFGSGSLWGVSKNSDFIYEFRPANGTWLNFKASITSPSGIAFDGKSSLWVVGGAAQDEFYVIDINSKNVEFKFESPGVCASGLEYYNDQLYVIGCNGITVLDPVSGNPVNTISVNSIEAGTDLTFIPNTIGANNNAPPSPAPIAHAGNDEAVMAGQSVLLDGGNSFDPEGNPLTYSWKIDSQPPGSMPELFGDTLQMPELTTDLVGLYILSLVVNDGEYDSKADTVSVAAMGPNSCLGNSACGYGNFCESPAGSCGGPGICSVIPVACNTLYAPVCGCDGVTYPNACEAAINGVSVLSEGEC